MDLSRQEYPALLASLQPGQAVSVLNERVNLITKVNSDIADWLQERRKVEEAYAAGLRKLARRPQQDGAASLGIFQMPWQRIVSGTENLAHSHETLAQKIDSDVESPLRQFATKNREMQSMNTIQGNLASISKEFEKSQRKADKLKERGGKADRVANASSGVEDASREWESQAPYVFEQLQSLDETRVNQLRDVLTQLQTHELDSIERNRQSAESCLNALLNVETADEIKTFAARIRGSRGSVPRRPSTVTSGSARPVSSAGPPPTPPPARNSDNRYRPQGGDNEVSDRAPPPQEKTLHKSSFGGIKRLGTVIGRRSSKAPPPPSSASEKRKTRSFAPFRRGDSSSSFQDLEETGRDLTPNISRETQRPSQVLQTSVEPSIAEEPPSRDLYTGVATTTAAVNGNHPFLNSEPAEPIQVPPSTNATVWPVPQELSAVPALPENVRHLSDDPTTRVQQDAYVNTAENEENARNLTIRDQPIPEDETEAQKAMSNMANQLRMQAQNSGLNRVQGSTRGRRDVRNTMFFPNTPETASTTTGTASSGFSPAPSNAAITTAAVVGTAGLGLTATEMVSPIKQSGVPGTIPEDHPTSDTASAHSSQSLAGMLQHPELHEPGLNVSIVESVSTWFADGGVSKSFVVGEIALAYNPAGSPAAERETIRLSNFQLLEKVAANPTFVNALSEKGKASALDDTAGEYHVSTSAIRRSAPTVALKYQLHLEAEALSTYSPVLFTPAWQLVEGQASVIVVYALNPTFVGTLAGSGEITLKNVAITVSLDTSTPDHGKATSAMMSPTQGASFKRKQNLVVWRMPELAISSEQKKLLVRFMTTGGLPKAGAIEAKWELEGGLGADAALGVKKLDDADAERDPFADESEHAAGAGSERKWADVPTKRKLVSGRYTASS